LLGGLGWMITQFFGGPIRRFFDLRGDLSDDEIERLHEAQRVFRDLAARMRAFAPNEHFAVFFVKRCYDPWEASVALLRVSNTLYKYGGARDGAKRVLERVLNFRVER
jgi:hypothetical protein